jgi:hypothetical protein
MKILNNEQISNAFQLESKTNAQPSTGKEFSAILRDTVENTTATTLASTQTTFVSPLTGFKSISSSPSDDDFAADSIEDMINLLDRYRNKLADPRITLKQIDPDITEMSRKIDNLVPVLDSLPADEGLRNILNQTMVTISLEISKFYRGDYISS